MSNAGSADYFAVLRGTLDGLKATLAAKGIGDVALQFGGEGVKPARKPTVPTDARSEFLAHRAMGDWAERTLAVALGRVFPERRIVAYGDSGRIAADHPDFKRHYLAGLEETRLYGKRPDLLIFDRKVEVPEGLSEMPVEASDEFARRALGAIEVRSSKFEALRYMKVRAAQKLSGTKPGRESPSFTVKVEDLRIVYRWIERYRMPQIYCQVFFDSLFVINFLEIFRLVAAGSGFTIEAPKKSQEKATIMIPITSGRRVGTGVAMPDFSAEHKVTKLGRHDAYVVPTGGGFDVDREALLATFTSL